MKLRTRVRPLAVIAVLAILSLVAAACGTGQESSTGSGGDNGSEAPENHEGEEQAAGGPFASLELWRQHIGFFVDYAEGAAGDDEQAMEQARSDLDGYRSQAGAFFEDISGGEIPADAVAESLKGHIQTLTEAIDGLAAAVAK